MSDTSLNKYLAQGDDAAEAAFTPVPVTGTTPEQAVLFVNDEAPAAPVLKWWNGLAFVSVGGGNVTTGATLTADQVIVGAGTTAVDVLAAGTDGDVLTMVSGAPAWQAGGGSGAIGQVVTFNSASVATGTALIPTDNSIPQNTEGTEFMTLAITPTNASSTLLIHVVAAFASSVARTNTVALFRDSTADALAAIPIWAPDSNSNVVATLDYAASAGSTSATTFKVRIGANNASTLTFNGNATNALYGAISGISSMVITEVLP